MAIKIITDSACDITKEMEQKCGVEIIPLQVDLDGNLLKDREDITPYEVYEKMRAGSAPKTSLVLSDRLLDSLTNHAKDGDEVIYLAFSGALSGSYNLAKLTAEDVCAEYPDFKVEVIDTKCASFGQGMVVLLACDALEKGMAYDEIVAKVRDWSDNMEHIFTVDDLEYLYRGGRVSKTSKVLGGLLGIKPILHVSDEGKLVALVPAEQAEAAVTAIRAAKYGEDACIVGYVNDKAPGKLHLRTRIGGLRNLEILQGEGLPRIC